MKALRFIFLALALLLQGGEAFAMDPVQAPSSCCCGDACPCPMPPPAAPRAPQAPAAVQTPSAQAPDQAAKAQAPRAEAQPWSGLPSAGTLPVEVGRITAVRPEADPPGGRGRLLQTSLLRI